MGSGSEIYFQSISDSIAALAASSNYDTWIALGGLVVAVVSPYLVFLSVKEMRRSRMDEFRPHFALLPETRDPNEEQINIYYINRGKGPLYNLRLKNISADYTIEKTSTDINERARLTLNVGLQDELKEQGKLIFAYQDVYDREYESVVPLDIRDNPGGKNWRYYINATTEVRQRIIKE